MRIVDPELLAEFRAATRCEWCGGSTPSGCDPAHIFSRGAGRVDIRANVISLCRPCHRCAHAGLKPRSRDLLKLAARREKTTVSAIERIVHRVRRTIAPVGWQDMTPQQLVEYAMRRKE